MMACLVLPWAVITHRTITTPALPLSPLPLLFKPCDTSETSAQYPTYIKAYR